MSLKTKILMAGATLLSTVTTVKAAYSGNYTEDDFVPILFDALGTGGVFVVTKINTIGSIILVLFVLGGVGIIVAKAKGIIKF